MPDGEQRETIAFLDDPATWADAAGDVQRIDTHISIVWLAGDRAWKLKRAVHFDYVDFSTPERRHAACLAEVAANRRTAPGLYVGVRAVTREADGRLAIDGSGGAVDWLVEMVRFDQETLFDRLATRGRLDEALMDGLGEAIADLHLTAEPRRDCGGRAAMDWVVDGNAAGFAEQGRGLLDQARGERLSRHLRGSIAKAAALLDRRRDDEHVRVCHGDLHLRNICLVDGRPTVFDAIEFNPKLSCIDVLYDVAFLLMDLWRRQLPAHANRVFNAYLARTLDLDGLALLPLFLSCRAGVRAKTTVTAAGMTPPGDRRDGLVRAAGEYLDLAWSLAFPPPPCLVAIGGFSGAGKSTLARALAPGIGGAPGALVLRSDTVRKALAGVPAGSRLDAAAYTATRSAEVYTALAGRAETALAAGHSVIVDAVFASRRERARLAAIARRAAVPFAGCWLEGSREVLGDRLRRRVGDASDATPEVLDRQLETGAGPVAWRRLDAERRPSDVAAEAAGIVAAVRARAVTADTVPGDEA
jgi:uncharacterized protein